jgi:hypothetical protein
VADLILKRWPPVSIHGTDVGTAIAPVTLSHPPRHSFIFPFIFFLPFEMAVKGILVPIDPRNQPTHRCAPHVRVPHPINEPAHRCSLRVPRTLFSLPQVALGSPSHKRGDVIGTHKHHRRRRIFGTGRLTTPSIHVPPRTVNQKKGNKNHADAAVCFVARFSPG